QVVAENVVEGYFERWDASCFRFALLDSQQIVLSAIGDFAQLIQFGIDATSNDIPFIHRNRRLGLQLGFDAFADSRTTIQLFSEGAKCLYRHVAKALFELFYRVQSPLQLNYFPRVCLLEADLTD